MHLLSMYFTIFFYDMQKKRYMLDLAIDAGVLSNRNEIPMNL